MDLNEYQKQCLRTYRNEEDIRVVLTKGSLCIAGEAGELANAVKKMLWHGHEVDIPKVEDELGDLMWYIATTARGLGIDLEHVAVKNIEKLKQRYPDGFKEEDSINRRI